ncbi:MAG: hypothetical protein DCC67_15140 [Planctomycetota bacterium]|nr:MAG: hypothetical protein DCC67_15140 [Planctomycetota bacterium]
MSRRRGETEGGVLSFTFLDVLSCTMGSLVLLVVVFGQRADKISLETALKSKHVRSRSSAGEPAAAPNASAAAADAAAPPTDGDPAEALNRLRQAEQDRAALATLREKALVRLAEERARVAGIEQHERRLEHELAQLHITLQRLEETEKKQSVDQQSADQQLARLRELVQETEEQLQSLQAEPRAKKSYAIVPYKGANGTFRRPVYVECTKEGVVIQPEGIRLTAQDFDGPLRSGNPLASAIRAAREELNARAHAAGEADLPDPYPLIIVRPDGAEYYALALAAISSWDADFGYEFVEADWKIEYPPQDPRLSQAMEHAVGLARERQALLARVAPRRYGIRAGGGVGGSGGVGAGRMELGVGEGGGQGSGTTPHGRSPASQTGRAGSSYATFAEAAAADADPRYGEIGGAEGEGEGIAGETGASPTTAAGGSGQHSATGGVPEDRREFADAGSSGAPAVAGDAPNGVPSGVPGGAPAPSASSGSAAGQPSAASMAAGQPGGSQAAGGGQAGAASTGGVALSGGSTDAADSAAKSRGSNWANTAASTRSTPITRPIQVLVKADKLTMLPEAQTASEPTVIGFDQATDKVLDDLAAGVQQRIEEWGLAGKGMYWRPTLVLRVAPGAERHAARLSRLLEDSGVDLRLEQVAARPTEDAAHAR